MKKIMLDTNFLLSVSELQFDVFTSMKNDLDFKPEFFVLEGVVEELEKLIKGSLLSKRQAAQFALKLLYGHNVKVIESELGGSVDDQLVALNGYIVATSDKALQERLKKKGTKILRIRQKNHVVLE